MNKLLITLILLLSATVCAIAQELKYSKNSTLTRRSDLKLEGNTISFFGRQIELDKNGFPRQIKTFFNPDVTGFVATPTLLLYENIHFHFVRKRDGKNIVLKDGGVQFLKKSARQIKWKSKNENDSLVVEVNGRLGADGFLIYTVKLKALRAVELKDVTMHIPFIPTAANEMMGFGIADGKRPEKVEWKWDGAFANQNGAWLGSASAGLQYSLQPGAWANNNNGGVTIGIKGSSMLANNYTGEHKMQIGDVLHYNFTLLVTPLQFVIK